MIERLINRVKFLFVKKKKRHPRLFCPPYYNIHRGEDILIFGSGPSIEKYRGLIDRFIIDNNLITIGTNNVNQIYKLNYHGFSNRKRFAENIKFVQPGSKILLSPHFTKKFISSYYKNDYWPLMYSSQNHSFRIANGIIYCPNATSGVLLASVAIVMGAGRIYLAGFDGYEEYSMGEGNINCLNVKPKYNSYDKNVSHYMKLQQMNYICIKEIQNYLKSMGRPLLEIITPTVFKEYYNPRLLNLD